MSTKLKYEVTGLIGEMCLIKVLLNNKLPSVLLDAGAQGSVISDKYLRQNFPHVDEYPVNETFHKKNQWFFNKRKQNLQKDWIVEKYHYDKRGC